MKPVRWLGSSLKDLRGFPRRARNQVGRALNAAQHGGKDPAAKAMKGFGGASVLEIVVPHDGDSFRTVYTVEYCDVIYVLHCFQKKSKTGIETPRTEIDIIKKRLASLPSNGE
jgi:phage-related protein